MPLTLGCITMTKHDSSEVFFSHSWYVTDWGVCSRSCGHGQQTRELICRMKIDSNNYGPSNKCPADKKPDVSETKRSCNSFPCFPEWDTHEGLSVSELRGLHCLGGGGGGQNFSYFMLLSYFQPLSLANRLTCFSVSNFFCFFVQASTI